MRASGIEETAMCLETTARLQDANLLSRVAEVLERTETILFVEDEAFVREVTCEVLQSAGYGVLTATNAVEATQLYDQRKEDIKLLLTDVVLPGETGRSLAVKLKQRNPKLKILFVTGYAEQMALQETNSEECLAKPFSAEALLRRVRLLLDQTQYRTGGNNSVRRAYDTA